MVSETTPLRESGGGGFAFDVAFRVRILTSVASLAEGYDLGVFNGALIPLKDELQLSHREVGIAMASTVYFIAISALLSGSIADTIGRKWSLGLGSLWLSAGNLVCAYAVGFKTLLAGRILLGMGIGLGIATVSVFLAEVAPAHTRGMYVSLEELFLNIGILLGFLSGALLLGYENDWRIMVGLGAVPAIAVVFCILTPYFPESPRYLHAVGRTEEAKVVLSCLLRGDKHEADQIFAGWEEEAREHVGTGSWWTVVSAFCTSHRRRAAAAFGVSLLQMLAGVQVVTFYSSLVLKDYGMTTMEAVRTTVFIGVVKTLFILVSSFWLLDGWGRQPSLITSAAGCAAGMGFIALACHMHWSASFIAVGLCIFSASFSLGLGPVTYAYMAEVFDTETRGKGVAAALFLSRIVSATYAALFPIMWDVVGLVIVFLYLTSINILGAAYAYFFCPETKGRTLEQMYEVFGSPAVTKDAGPA